MELPKAELDIFDGREVLPVDGFYSSAIKGNDAHRYPGDRPEGSYVTDGDNVFPLGFLEGNSLLRTGDSIIDIDDFLYRHDQPGTEERIAIVGYGSNVCPPTLAKKLEYGGRPDLKILPVIYGWMQGIDAVWHERPGQRGAFFAELYAGEETEQTNLRVGVGLFTPEQLLFIHKGEQTYDLGQFSTVKMDDGNEIPALMYVGSERILELDGSPVAVSGIERENPQLKQMTSRDALGCLLEKQVVRKAIALIMESEEEQVSEDSYTQYVQELPTIAAKRAFNDQVSSIVRRFGLSSEFSMSEVSESDLSWANPSTLPNFGELVSGNVTKVRPIRLPEQEIQRGLGDEALKRRQAVLSAQRKHWHRRNDRHEAKV